MKESKFTESKTLQKRHFARLHEKIQNKYEEMQKRMEKSKSIDSLDNISDDSTAHKIVKGLKTEKFEEMSIEHNVQTAKVELNHNEFEAELLDFEDDFKISMEDLNKSYENLSELSEESGPDTTQQNSSTPPISKRYKIGTRIKAVKQKLRADKKKNEPKIKESFEDVEKFVLSNTNVDKIIKNQKKTPKSGTLTVALIEITGLIEIKDERLRQLFCRFRLGNEKMKSKTIKSNSSQVTVQEMFNFNIHDDDLLDITLWDKDTLLGKSSIDLSLKKTEKTHRVRINLEGDFQNIELFLLLTISGTDVNNIIDQGDYTEYEDKTKTLTKKHAWFYLRNDYKDVGSLLVIVYGAKGLSSNDCYCILEVGNDRLHTHTEMKTNCPNWMKLFTFQVTDIASLLEVTIADEKKNENVGKLLIPLLGINHGEKKWYALKDNTLRERAKGHNPRVLLEFRVSWNLVKASIRVINPKEIKYLEEEMRLHRHTFTRNLSRAKAVLSWVLNAAKVVKTCFEWEDRRSNVIALCVWMPLCYFFKAWMVPIILIIPFVYYTREKYNLLLCKKYPSKSVQVVENEKAEKSSLKQKLNNFQEILLTVQQFLGKFASFGERTKNLFNFTVPFLSFVAIFLLSVITVLLYFIPVKYIFIAWGLKKFTRKILQPNRVPNNEAMDLISRVPDDEAMLSLEEFPLEEIENEDEI